MAPTRDRPKSIVRISRRAARPPEARLQLGRLGGAEISSGFRIGHHPQLTARSAGAASSPATIEQPSQQ